MFRHTHNGFKRLTVLVLNVLLLNQAFAYPLRTRSEVNPRQATTENLFDMFEWTSDEGRMDFMPAAPIGTSQAEQSESESNAEEEYGSSEYQLLESIRNQFCFHTPGADYIALLHIRALIQVATEIPTPPPQA